jgi:hypothetical protein
MNVNENNIIRYMTGLIRVIRVISIEESAKTFWISFWLAFSVRLGSAWERLGSIRFG